MSSVGVVRDVVPELANAEGAVYRFVQEGLYRSSPDRRVPALQPQVHVCHLFLVNVFQRGPSTL